MARYFLEQHEGPAEPISPAIYNILVEGTSVLDAQASERVMRLALSEELAVSTIAEGHVCYVMLRSTLESGRVRPVRVPLVLQEGSVSMRTAEERGRHLSQFYSLLFLIESDRINDVAKALSSDWNFDLETLLDADDHLMIEAAAEGSFWVVVKNVGKVAKEAGDKTIVALGALFKDGRALLLRYSDAVVRTKVAGASLKELEVEAGQQELINKQLEIVIKEQDSQKRNLMLRRLEDLAAIERADKLLELYAKVDKTLPPERAERVKMKLYESLTGTNPDIPRLPPQ